MKVNKLKEYFCMAAYSGPQKGAHMWDLWHIGSDAERQKWNLWHWAGQAAIAMDKNYCNNVIF